MNSFPVGRTVPFVVPPRRPGFPFKRKALPEKGLKWIKTFSTYFFYRRVQGFQLKMWKDVHQKYVPHTQRPDGKELSSNVQSLPWVTNLTHISGILWALSVNSAVKFSISRSTYRHRPISLLPASDEILRSFSNDDGNAKENIVVKCEFALL